MRQSSEITLETSECSSLDMSMDTSKLSIESSRSEIKNERRLEALVEKVEMIRLRVEIKDWNKTSNVDAINVMNLGKFLVNEAGTPIQHYETMEVLNVEGKSLDKDKTIEENYLENNDLIKVKLTKKPEQEEEARPYKIETPPGLLQEEKAKTKRTKLIPKQ